MFWSRTFEAGGSKACANSACFGTQTCQRADVLKQHGNHSLPSGSRDHSAEDLGYRPPQLRLLRGTCAPNQLQWRGSQAAPNAEARFSISLAYSRFDRAGKNRSGPILRDPLRRVLLLFSLEGHTTALKQTVSTVSWPRRGLPTMDHTLWRSIEVVGAGTSTTLPLSPDRETSPWGTTIILDLLLLAITSIDLWLRMARVGLALIRGYAS